MCVLVLYLQSELSAKNILRIVVINKVSRRKKNQRVYVFWFCLVFCYTIILNESHLIDLKTNTHLTILPDNWWWWSPFGSCRIKAHLSATSLYFLWFKCFIAFLYGLFTIWQQRKKKTSQLTYSTRECSSELMGLGKEKRWRKKEKIKENIHIYIYSIYNTLLA